MADTTHQPTVCSHTCCTPAGGKHRLLDVNSHCETVDTSNPYWVPLVLPAWFDCMCLPAKEVNGTMVADYKCAYAGEPKGVVCGGGGGGAQQNVLGVPGPLQHHIH